MKKLILIALLAGWGHSFAQKTGNALEYKQHINKQFTLQKAAAGSVLALYNVFGDVKLEGYSGNQVMIEVEATIRSNKAEDLEIAKRDFKAGFDQKADSIIVYTAAPYDTRPNKDNNHTKRNYMIKLDYTVKIPNNMNIKVATVNSGEVIVKDVYGTINASNVNGPINIVNAKGTTYTNTVNGNITASYLAVPAEGSNYKTVNGKVEVTYPATLSADLQLKSFHGEFYTDFTNTEKRPVEVIKTVGKKDNTTTYSINKNTKIRVGNGGKLFKFETLNGNIYIKKS
jgi:hypothetical protein